MYAILLYEAGCTSILPVCRAWARLFLSATRLILSQTPRPRGPTDINKQTRISKQELLYHIECALVNDQLGQRAGKPVCTRIFTMIIYPKPKYILKITPANCKH